MAGNPGARKRSIKKAPAPEKTGGETTAQLVNRVKKDMRWVAASAAAAMGLGLVAGQLFRF